MLSLVVLSAVLTLGECFSDGAPVKHCVDMTPTGHGVDAQTTDFPYAIILSAVSINSDAQLSITINSNDGSTTFKGFLIEARTTGTDSVGTFTTGEDAKAITCPGGTNNAATHVNNSPKTQVVLQWSPPQGYNGTVYFVATVVKVMTEYWVAQKSSQLTVTS